jgi:prepilin-type N-terminal cleavage/methylation domain-containing protein
MRNRKAFTLAEMLVVMGIIVVFILAAIPCVRALTGSGSVSSAKNELASLVTRAREEAIAMQEIRGVLFFIDPGSDRVTGIICQPAPLQDSLLTGQGIILLDAMPGKDSLTLPGGVRLQTLFNGNNSGVAPDDRYLGFNPLTAAGKPPLIGGCILFDGNGKLVVRQYGFQMAQAGGLPSNLCSLLANAYPSSGLSAASGVINNAGSSSYLPTIASAPPLSGTPPSYPDKAFATVPYSQLGLVLFGQDEFKSQGFTDTDPDQTLPPATGQMQAEQTEEAWIDAHSTPVLINRYNGTLIKGE